MTRRVFYYSVEYLTHLSILPWETTALGSNHPYPILITWSHRSRPLSWLPPNNINLGSGKPWLLSFTYKSFMMSAIRLNVIMLNVVILSVVAPFLSTPHMLTPSDSFLESGLPKTGQLSRKKRISGLSKNPPRCSSMDTQVIWDPIHNNSFSSVTYIWPNKL